VTDYAAVAERLVDAYNAKDFDALEALIDPHLDFAHFNRNFAFSERAPLMGVLRHFAAEFIPDRRFLPTRASHGLWAPRDARGLLHRHSTRRRPGLRAGRRQSHAEVLQRAALRREWDLGRVERLRLIAIVFETASFPS